MSLIAVDIPRFIGEIILTSGLVMFFTQKYIEHKFNEKFHKYKSDIDFELEKAKITFSGLQSKREEIISTLYEKLAYTQDSLVMLTKPLI